MSCLRILSAIVPALLAASCNFVTLPPAPEPSPLLIQRNTVSTYTPQRPPEVQVWLLADKLHTGMVFPYGWLLESGFIPPENFPKCEFVTFSPPSRSPHLDCQPPPVLSNFFKNPNIYFHSFWFWL
jgi:hypothetical protein